MVRPEDGGRASGHEKDRQLRGSSLLLGGQSFALIVNFATQILIVRYLSKTDYGVFAYALSLVVVGEAVAGFGLRRAVGRLTPIYEERGEIAKAAGTLAFAITGVISIGLAVALATIGLRGVITGSVAGESAAVVLAIMIALGPIQALAALLDGALAVFDRPKSIVLRQYLISPALRLSVVGLLVLADRGVVFLAWGYLAAGVIGIAVYAPTLAPILRQRGFLDHMRPWRNAAPIREILAFTTPLLTSDLASATLIASGPIVVGILASGQDVASLRAVYPVVLTMGYVLASFGIMFEPLAARLYARRDSEELGRVYWQTALWTTVLAFPILLLSTILAEPVATTLFGARYQSSGPILAVLALGYFVNTAVGPNGVLLGIFGEVRFLAITNLIVIGFNLVLTVILVAAYGAIGAAAATSVSYLALNVARQAGLGSRTPIRAVDPRYAVVWLVAAATGAAAFAIGVALSPSLLLGGALAGVCWAAVLASAWNRLDLLETFPEVARLIPVGRRSGQR